MTPEQEHECQVHLDALLELTSGFKLSTIFDGLKQQMKLSSEDEKLIFDTVQSGINESIKANFAKTSEQLKQLFDNPEMQAEMRAKMDEVLKSNGGVESKQH